MRLAIIYLALVAVQLVSIGSTHGSQIYSISQRGKAISTVNSTSGVGQDLGLLDRPDSYGTAFDPNGELYITSNRGTTSELSRVNPQTGKTVFVGSFPLIEGSLIQAIDFNSQGDLFAITGNGKIFQLSKSAGSDFGKIGETDELEMQLLGEAGVSNVSDIAINSRGHLYGVAQGELFAFNLQTGELSPKMEISIQGDDQNSVNTTDVRPTDIMGIMFDEHDALFATAHVNNSPLFSLDPSGTAKALSSTELHFPIGGDCPPVVLSGLGPISLIARGASPGSSSMFSRSGGISSRLQSGGGGGGGGGGSAGGGFGGGGSSGGGLSPTDFVTPTDDAPTDDPEYPPATATPEPSTLIIFGIGIVGIAIFEFTRRHRPASPAR